MARQEMNLVEFTKRLSTVVFAMCEPHGEFYVAAKRHYLRLDDSDLNKKVFPSLFGEDAAAAAEPDDIFLYWLGDWVLACKACLDPGTAESVATEIYGKPAVERLRADIARLKVVPGFPQRGTFQDIDALEYPTFLRAVAKIDPQPAETPAKKKGGSKVSAASKQPRRPRKGGVHGDAQSRRKGRELTASKNANHARTSATRKAAGLKRLVAGKLS